MSKLEDTGERLIPELHKQSLTYGEHLSRYAAAKSLVKGKTVLDIASGTGYGTALLAASAKKVIGVDYDKDAIEYSKKLYKLDNIKFIQGDAQDLPLGDSSVDVVVSLETIEHLPNPEKFVLEVKRVLKPNGVFYVSTPNDDEHFDQGNVYHLHEFDFKELNETIQKHFKRAKYYYQGSWYASGILGKTDFTGENALLQARKTFGQPVEQAIYYLAVASNGPSLPELDQNVIVADKFSELKALNDHNAIVNDIKNKNKRIEDLEKSRQELIEHSKKLDDSLTSILNSRGWKLLTTFYDAKKKIRRRQ